LDWRQAVHYRFAGTSDTGQSHDKRGSQVFNMCNYAAPKLETVRIGFIGLGNRGMAAVERMNKIEGVEIKALCDLRPEKVAEATKMTSATGHQPQGFHTSPDAWKKLCEMPRSRPDLHCYALGIAYADGGFFDESRQACMCGSTCGQNHSMSAGNSWRLRKRRKSIA
jgi:hypothetical protein